MTRYQHLITDENRKWWTLGAMCFALFMVMLDNTVVNVALPSIQRDLGASISGLEWAVNGYTLSFGVFLATAGRLGDIFGRRRGFLVGVTVFTLSSIACGVSTSTTMLIVARVFQGLGAAFMMPATLSIVTNAFSPAERGRAIGTWAGVSAVALAIGPVVGGFLTEQVSWQSIFFLNVPVGIVAILATVFAVRESRDHTVDHKLDPLGVGALTISLTALVVALVDGNSWGWSSPEIIALFAVFVVFAGAFIVIEPRVKAPIIDFSFLKSRDFLGANLVGFVVSFAMFGVFFFIALYMQDILGYSPLEAGVRFLPSTLAIVLLAPVAGRVTDRIGPRWPIVGGLTLVALSLLLQTRISVGDTYADIWIVFVLLGMGLAFTITPMSTAAMNSVKATKAGVASGILSMSRMIGGTVGVAAIGAVFQSRAGDFSAKTMTTASPKAAAAFIDALTHAMRLSLLVTLLGIAIAVVLIRGRSAVATKGSTGRSPAATKSA